MAIPTMTRAILISVSGLDENGQEVSEGPDAPPVGEYYAEGVPRNGETIFFYNGPNTEQWSVTRVYWMVPADTDGRQAAPMGHPFLTVRRVPGPAAPRVLA